MKSTYSLNSHARQRRGRRDWNISLSSMIFYVYLHREGKCYLLLRKKCYPRPSTTRETTRNRSCFCYYVTSTPAIFLQLSSGTTGSPSAICVGSGFRGHLVEFGRNILELLVYYLMLNKCKILKIWSLLVCLFVPVAFMITKDDISCIITCDSGP